MIDIQQRMARDLMEEIYRQNAQYFLRVIQKNLQRDLIDDLLFDTHKKFVAAVTKIKRRERRTQKCNLS